MSFRKFNRSMLTVACLLLVIGPAWSRGEVTLGRIVKEHLMHVVSTEKPETISRYIFDLRLRDSSVITSTDLIVKTKGLKDGEGLLFMIDRSKSQHLSAQEEAFLPCPTSAIASNEVILYARKAIGRNAWEILISAPSEKWLCWELARLCQSTLQSVRLDERGSVLDRYVINRLLVVSTEGRDVADKWIQGQTIPGRDTIEWDYLDAESWTSGANNGVNTVFLLNRQKMTDKSAAVVTSLPREIQTWFAADSNKTGIAAAKETIQTCSVYGVVAPCTRHLTAALSKYSALDRVPASLDQQRLHDLSGYGQMVIVVRSGDRSQDNSVINDFGGKLNSALSTADLGFAGVSRQDLKELVFQSIADSDKIDSAQLLAIRKKIPGARALAVADLTAVDASTNYVANSPVCETSQYPAFTKPEPTAPHKPDPDEKVFFKPRYGTVNGSRANNPGYIKDINHYYETLLPEYERAHRQWANDKDEYENSRRNHEMEWGRSVDAVQRAKVTGNLRIYDAGSLGTDTAGQLVFSCSLSGSGESRGQFKSDKVSLRGEESRPDSLDAPESRTGVSDLSVISQALEQACNRAAGEIKQTAMLPSDVPDYVPGVVKAPEVKYEQIAADAVGAAKLASKPTGAALDSARATALENSYPKLLKNIILACPTASVSNDEIKAGAKIISEGWNAQTREYRVKAHFEGSVVVEQPKTEGTR